MSRPKRAEVVKVIMSLICRETACIGESLSSLSETYGAIDFVSPLFKFAYTDYYADEMGGGLHRRFVAFEKLVAPETLPDIKMGTNALEMDRTDEGRRQINIDPGYIAQAHLILATGKGYSHRPYLRDGIYADLTLMYRSGSFHGLPWTYPDYGSPEVIAMLNRIRQKYVEQLKSIRNAK